MSTSSENDLEAARQAALKSVSAGGESASYDHEQLKAIDRDRRNSDPVAVVNGRTRPWLVSLMFGGFRD